MAKLSLKGVRKVYENNAVAVQDFNLEIEDKEFIVLVGPSGCGKSTTLRMVAGLEEISDGDIYIGDKRVNDVDPKDRDIAMVFQNYALYPHMTVYENMAFALKLRKMPKEEIDRKVRESADILGITDYLKRKPKALSGGQRQRVAIGRAIVRDPQVFLMDEPLSNLDAKLRNQMRAEIIKLRQRINTTFIYVTHDQTEAMTLGDRIVIMKDGLIQQIGNPQQVFTHPANLFVAGFIGTPQMNFLDGKLVYSGGVCTLDCMGVQIPLSPNLQAELKAAGAASQEVVIGVRPEHITLSSAAEPHSFSGKLDVSEMMGSEIHLHITVRGKDMVLRLPTIGLPEKNKAGFKHGDEIRAAFRDDSIHLFNSQTGENLIPFTK